MLRFKMTRINIEQFAMLGDDPKQIKEFSIEVGFKYAVESRHLAVVFGFSFDTESEKAVVLKVCCEFLINKDDWDAALSDGKYTIPATTLQYLASQTVGASRGILHCKTEGSPFSSMIIPPINLTELVSEDLTFSCGESEDGKVIEKAGRDS